MWSVRAVRRVLAGHSPSGLVAQAVHARLTSIGVRAISGTSAARAASVFMRSTRSLTPGSPSESLVKISLPPPPPVPKPKTAAEAKPSSTAGKESEAPPPPPPPGGKKQDDGGKKPDDGKGSNENLFFLNSLAAFTAVGLIALFANRDEAKQRPTSVPEDSAVTDTDTNEPEGNTMREHHGQGSPVSTQPRTHELSWQELRRLYLDRGLVERIEIINRKICRAYLRGLPPVACTIGSVETFERRLDEAQDELGVPQDKRISVKYIDHTPFLSILANFAPSLLFIGALIFLSRSFNPQSMGGGIFGVGASKAKLVTPEMVNVKFADVAGMDEAKQEIMEFVNFLKTPQTYQALGAKVPKGALLSGPPGTGKTMLAKATAGEAGVPFLATSGSEFLEMFVGVGPSRVRDLFQQAKENTPCIVFIDEIDAIGRARGQGKRAAMGNDERENTLNQILVEMDGFDSSSGVVVLAGTNRADMLDAALLRPGRFDRQIQIDLPDLTGRVEIFKVHLKKIKTKSPDDIAAKMAQMTPGFSGADIANVCNEAALIAGRQGATEVTDNHFEAAVERVVGGLEKRSKVLAQDERKTVAYHEAGHAVAGWFLPHADPLLKVSIIPRGSAALGYAMSIPKDQYLYTKEQLFDRMCMTMGGRASERIFFNHMSSGAQDDLRKITDIAYSQIKKYGMNEAIGPLAFDESENDMSFERPYSEETALMMDKEARKLIDTVYEHTIKLLTEKKQYVEAVAERLLKREVLKYEDLVELIGPRPSGIPSSVDTEYLEGKKAAPEDTTSAGKS